MGLREQNVAELNRQRVRESQRILIHHMLTASFSVAVLLSIVVVLAELISLVLYARGWFIMLHESQKPCDKPLKHWLLAMLLQPAVRCLMHQRELDSWKKELTAVS